MDTLHSPATNGTRDYFPFLILLFVFVSRILTSGPAYFGDGPSHLDVIHRGSYLIQQPGYWLFNRLAGFFPDAEAGILFMNWTFSALGVVFFYYLSRELFSLTIARLGSLAYSVIFFAWFSGNVHSTYASQLLLPVLMFYLLTRHRKTAARPYLYWASAAFAAGAGFRPSDGVFLAPLFCYHLMKYAAWKDRILAAVLTGCCCLVWLVPTLYNDETMAEQVVPLAQAASIFVAGFTVGTLANALRFFVPCAVAFWPLALLFRRVPTLCNKELLVSLCLWMCPGTAFFLLIYISDAPYLNYLLPAVLLLAMACAEMAPTRIARVSLVACALWNAILYLCFVPINPAGLPRPTYAAVSALNVYVGKYTRWAVKHQWTPRLSELIQNRN